MTEPQPLWIIEGSNTMPRLDFCSSCRKPIYMLPNLTTGKPAPIDADPTIDGNVVIVDHPTKGRCWTVVPRTAKLQPAMPGMPQLEPAAVQPPDRRYKNHFATCPYSGRHR